MNAAVYVRRNGCKWAPCTEILGFESHKTEVSGGGDGIAAAEDAVEREKDGGRREEEEEEERERGGGGGNMKSFPPLLSTLSEDGRRRFDLKKVTLENGRLTMWMVRNDKNKTVLRCTRRDGRLKMWLVPSDEFYDSDFDHDQEE